MFGKTPSPEISRLVLGYLVDVKCLQTALTFLEECDHFKLYKNQLQQYIRSKSDISSFDVNVFGETLLTIVHEYSEIKARMNKTSFAVATDPLQQVTKHRLDFSGTAYQHSGNEKARENLLNKSNENKEINHSTPICDTLFSLPGDQPAISSHNTRDGKQNKSRERKLKTPLKRISDVMKDSSRNRRQLTEAEFHAQINKNAGLNSEGVHFSTPSASAQCIPTTNQNVVDDDDEAESLHESSPSNSLGSDKKSSRINLRSLLVPGTKQKNGTSSGSTTLPCTTLPTRDGNIATPSSANGSCVNNLAKVNISGFLFASATVSSPCETNRKRCSVPPSSRNTLPTPSHSPLFKKTPKKVTFEKIEAGNSPSTASSLPQVVEMDKSAVQPVDTLKDLLPSVRDIEIQETVTNDGTKPQEIVAMKPNEFESTTPDQSILTVELYELDEERSMTTAPSTSTKPSTEQSPALTESKQYETRKRRARQVFDVSPSRNSRSASKILKETIPDIRRVISPRLRKIAFSAVSRSSSATPVLRDRSTRCSNGKGPVIINVSSPRSKRLLDCVTVSVDPGMSDTDAVLQLVKKIKNTDRLAKK